MLHYRFHREWRVPQPSRPPGARSHVPTLQQERKYAMRVRELMTQPVRSCAATETADRAAYIMWEADCGAVPVVDDVGRLTGVVTDRDLCMAAMFHGTALNQISISDVMTGDVCACHPEDELADAEQLMSVRQVHRLPVVGDLGEPIGMLSVTDVVQQVKPAPRFQKAASATDECLRTLAAISEPRTKTDTNTVRVS
jgi:CBS domain-containing protein